MILIKAIMMPPQTTGMTLLGTLIATLIMGIGISALVKLQSLLLQTSQQNQDRTSALLIAQQKLADLKSFTQLSSDPALFDFNDIADNQGGNLTMAGQLIMPAGTIKQANQTFNLSWQVENGYWRNDTLTYSPPTPLPVYPDQKRLTISVSWQQEQIQLQNVIAAISPLGSQALLDPKPAYTSKIPQIADPFASQPNPVSIGLDDGQQRRTWSASPRSNSQIISSYSVNLGGILQRKEEFLTVACDCAFTSPGLGYTSAHPVWNPLTKSYQDKIGDLLQKDRGCVSDGQNRCIETSDIACSRCCNDHHDPDQSQLDSNQQAYCQPSLNLLQACYDPYRSGEDFNTGKHQHYNNDGIKVSSGAYVESCRFKRINGAWQLYQDWHRVALTILPTSSISSSVKPNLYNQYVQQIINAILDSKISQFYGQSSTAGDTQINWPKPPEALVGPIKLKPKQSVQLSSYGLYIDYLSPELLNATRDAKAIHQDYLAMLPFYPIDLSHIVPYPSLINGTCWGWCLSPSEYLSLNLQTSIAELTGLLPSPSPLTINFKLRRSNTGLFPLRPPSDSSQANNSDHLIDQASLQIQVSD